MNSDLWKIDNGTTNQSAADWGIERVYVKLISQQADQLTFNAGEEFDADVIFDYGDTLSLYKDTVRCFVGKCISTPRSGSPTEESHDYEVAGLWWYLENLPFEQAWKSGDVATINPQHVLLGRDIDDAQVSVGEVIKEVLDFCIAAGAPFSYVQAELDLLDAIPPTDEQVNIACSEAIRIMLRWYPDTDTWFDYSPATPVLHFTRRSAATALQYDCTAGDPAESIHLSRRDDMVRTGVILNYERTDEIDGERIPVLFQDIYPGGTTPGFDTASITIELAGMQLVTQSIKVVVDDSYDETSVAFWQKYVTELEDCTSVTIHSGSAPAEAATMPNILIEGSVPEWTNKDAANGKFTAEISYTQPDGTEVSHGKFSVSLTLTDAETHKYTREVSYTPAESPPTGLAQALYEALSVAHFQGTFSTIEEEVTLGPDPGKVLNLTGGLSEWATMKADIQAVELDIDAGRTIITFGPPEHLGPQDYIALLNANRRRRTRYSADRSSGNTGSDIEAGGASANALGGGSVPSLKKLIITDGQDPVVNQITLDPSDMEKDKVLKAVDDGSGNLNTEWGDAALPSTVGKSKYMLLQIDTAEVVGSVDPVIIWDELKAI